MNADRPMLGIALMLGFCVTAPLGDSTAKLLGQPEFGQPVFQVVLLRFVMQGLFLVPLLAGMEQQELQQFMASCAAFGLAPRKAEPEGAEEEAAAEEVVDEAAAS